MPTCIIASVLFNCTGVFIALIFTGPVFLSPPFLVMLVGLDQDMAVCSPVEDSFNLC